MRKFFSFLLLTFVSISLHAQHYDSGIMPYQTGYGGSGALKFSFKNLPAGIYSDAKVTVYFRGDFGDYSEYVEVYHGSDYIGETVADYNNECSSKIDSNVIYIDMSTFTSYIVGDSIVLDAYMSYDVDAGNCGFPNFVSLRLEYDYCPFGVPVNLAQFVTTPITTCAFGSSITLDALPAGGVFSGAGVSNNVLDVNALEPNSKYRIKYTFVDNIGCESYDYLEVNVLPAIGIFDTEICKNTAFRVNPGVGYYQVFSDMALSNLLYEGDSFESSILNAPTTFYVRDYFKAPTFKMASLDFNDYHSVDMNSYAGDDRGGIAVTPQYVYFVGDNNTVRYNADDLTNPVSLPIMDGLISNLKDGKLYTLYNISLNEVLGLSTYEFDALHELDTNLNLVGSPMPLNRTYYPDFTAYFAGYDQFGYYDFYADSLFVFDFNGSLKNVYSGLNFEHLASENWASWGVLETDNTGLNLVFRDYTSNNVVRLNVNTLSSSILIDPNVYGISDLATLTYSPWNQRFYFHYEGSGYFGNHNETAGYIQGVMTIDTTNFTAFYGCPKAVNVSMDIVDLGADIVACENYPFVTLFAGNGYESYTWNGVNNNYNLLPVTQDGTYTVEVVNDLGCVITDTIHVSFTAACLDNEEAELATISVYPNPTTEFLNITIDGIQSSNWDVKVLDMNGRVVRITNFTGNVYSMNVSEFATGIYTLQLVSDNGEIQNIRVIKK